MPEVLSFNSNPMGQSVTWKVAVEDETANRWSTTVMLPRMQVSVEVLVPCSSSRASRLKVVNRAISNLRTRFDSNITKILRWYADTYPNGKPKAFERELLQSATLYLDFTVTPVKRELIFWRTHLQHLGVPISTHGNVP
jgi:hypothetical protein